MSHAYRKSLLAGSALLASYALLSVPAAVAGSRDGANVPPPAGAHAGQCFAKVRGPDTTEQVSERVLVRPAGSTTRSIPAVTRVVERTVEVSPATTQTIVHPAVYRDTRRAVVIPGPARMVETPARYRVVMHRVLLEAAHTVWKQGAGTPVTGQPGYGQAAYVPTGMVMCRVLVPARYAVTTERVQVSPGGRRGVAGPPEVRHLRYHLLVSPARTQTIGHAAITRRVRETVVVSPARTEVIPVPAQHRTVVRTRTTAHYGWQPVVCAPKPAPAPVYAPRPARTYQAVPYVAPQDMGRRPPYGERG